MHRSRSRFCFCDAAYQNICSMRRWNSYGCRIPLWNIRKCGRRPCNYADWRKNYSMIRSSCCGWHSRSPSHRSSGKSLYAGADWTNTAPTSHSYSCGRLHRWFRSWSDRRRRNTTGNRCWYRWLPAGSAIPMYGCRSPGKCRNRRRPRRGSYRCKCQGTGRNGRHNTRYSLHDHAKNVRLQRMCPGTNTFRMKGSCQ